MTPPSAPATTTPAASVPASPASSAPAPPSWPWRRGALILAGAAQLITISDLVTSDYPLAATWWSLLLAIAPAPVAAVAAFAPAPVNLVAGVAGVVVLVAGIAGGIVHIGRVLCPGARGAGRRYRQAVA
jgi:hypothetical protein